MISELYIAPPDYRPGKGEKEITLHSIDGALNEIANLRARHLAAEKVTVFCKGGIYPLKRTIVITPDMPGNVEFKPAPGETPVFDGGEKLIDWQEAELNGKKVFCTSVPEHLVFDGRVETLYVNGKAATRAQFPKNYLDAYKIDAPYVCRNDDYRNGSEGFIYRKGDFNPKWYNIKGIEALVLQLWTDSHLPIRDVDAKKRLVRFSYHSAWRFDCAAVRYCWQNVREALTEPGEFYFDNTDNKIYYLPRRGEKLDKLDAYVPRVSIMLLLCGSPGNNRPVRNLKFTGLHFRYGGAGRPMITKNYTFPDCDKMPEVLPNFFAKAFWESFPFGCTASSGSPQADAQLPGVVTMFGAENCAISGCDVSNSNFYAVCLAGGCAQIDISGNHFHDLGAGGVIVNGANVSARPDKAVFGTHNNCACNNHIHDCGNFYLGASAFLIGNAWGNLFEHNHIHDLYYSGFSCGWTWGYSDASCRENRIGYNLIHDLGKGVLCDMGGVYMLGIQPGSRIYHNHIYNVKCRIYGGWGIYMDEGSSHMVVENNICHDCSWEGYHQHFGRENVVRGNVFACNLGHQIALSKGKEFRECYAFPGINISRQINLFNNIVVSDGVPFFKFMSKEAAQPEEFISEINYFWDISGKKVKIFAAEGELLADHDDWTADFKAWQKSGHDLLSKFVDPGFVDIEKRDFHFRKNSPLLKAGFPDTAQTLDLAGLEKKKAARKAE